MSTLGKMRMPKFTAIVALLAVFVYFWIGFRVGRARVKFGIKAPATNGNPDFERAFQIQMSRVRSRPTDLEQIGNVCLVTACPIAEKSAVPAWRSF
jgi:hypothetical protein